jgi:hypothetical protein
MDINAWLKAACDDAERRGLAGLKPLLETLARSTAALREADAAARGIAPHEEQGSPEGLRYAGKPAGGPGLSRVEGPR